jgi:AcrR family transcriptional regulator
VTEPPAVGKRRLLGRAERAASILAAAARAFGAAGYAGTSMDDIAAEAGVTRLILYRHFDSKQQLYEAVLDHTRAQLQEGLAYRERGPRPEMLRELLRVVRADPHGFRLLFWHAPREPRFAAYSASLSDQVAGVAEQGMREQIPDPQLRGWLAGMVGDFALQGILSWLEVGDESRDDEAAQVLVAAAAGIIAAAANRGTHPSTSGGGEPGASAERGGGAAEDADG